MIPAYIIDAIEREKAKKEREQEREQAQLYEPLETPPPLPTYRF